MTFSRIVILAVLTTFANAGPLHHKDNTKKNSCTITCPDINNSKFNYQTGTVYEFSYDAKTVTKMNGASEDSAMIKMNAKVEIEPLTKCDLVMRITDASLRDSEDDQNSQTFKEAMMKQPLKFSFQDGRIDLICAMDGDSTWTLNIKRGILSAFQNSMDNFDRNQNVTETDVVGSCDAEYKILDEGRRVMLLKKTKNLLGCSDREGYRMAVQSIGYNVPSFVKSLPLMKSEYKCTQTLDLGLNILQSSTCSEEHVFRPFSSGKNGAMTSSEQTLTFVNKKRAGRPSNGQFRERSTLLFHHQHDTPSKQEKEDKIEAKLQELCKKATEDIRPEVPEMVNQLIEHMRQVDRDVLSRVYKKINQKSICASKADRIKQYFHDAIPMVGTEASVGMIQDLISKKHVTGSEAEMWLLSLSFVHDPSKEMVAAIMPLLDEHDVSGNILLAVSSLASSYCNERSDCGKDSEISTLIRKLMHLTHDCNDQNVDARKIVFALRALGNIGHSHEAVSHLSRCFTRQDVSEEIRIAAMDAFRRIPCDAVRSDLMGVFRDESEDSELRINAYIGFMKCPSRDILSEVRQVLEKEKSNQVGSFVWSHLTNLMETSDPHMQDIRNIVQDEELKKEFNLDQRKFSRNYEGSFFFDSINTGAKVDSNVIFSQKSFIPRSANLNLTIDLFGYAINFLEFGGRVQGVEKILENFFGPVGVKEPKLKTKTPLNFDKNMESFRSSAFLRVFGNELRYWDEKSLVELQSSLQKLMRMQALSFSKTLVLLDSRMIIPTCIGLPLNLTMSSTGSISIDAKASFQQGKFQMNVDFKPSASIQVKGEMSVDAHVSRAGLKMVTVAHTSTGARLNIGNNKFDLQIPEKKMEIFNLKTDFYIVHRNTEKKQKMIVDNVKKHEICTGKLMKQVTGLTFCQIIKFPNASRHNEAPFFPFTGPVVYDLYMMNEDAPNGYQIELFSPTQPYSFNIDTPGSKTQRKIALKTGIKNKNEIELSFTAPWEKIQFEGAFVNRRDLKKLTGKLSVGGKTNLAFSAQLDVKSEQNSVTYTSQLEMTILQKKLKYKATINANEGRTFMMIMDAEGFTADQIGLKVSGENLPENIGLVSQLKIGKKEYLIDSHLGRSVSTAGFKYSPSLRISVRNEDIVEFTSEINYIPAKRASLQFKLKKVFSKMIDFNVGIVRYHSKMKSRFSFVCALKAPIGYGQIISHTDTKNDMWMSRVTATYNLGQKYSDRLTLFGMLKEINIAKSRRFITKINLQSQMRPSLNVHATGELTQNTNLFETNVEVQHGHPDKKVENNFRFHSVAKRDLKPSSHIYNCTISFKYPSQDLDYKMEAKHVQSAKWPFKKFENNVMVQMAPRKVVQTKLSYNIAKVKGLPTYKSEVALSYPGRDMKMANKLMQVNRNTYENHFTVQWQKGREAAVQSTYTKTGKDIHNIENTLRLPNKKEAKASAMLQVTRGAYKTKLRFSADEEMISRQQIKYMAEGGVTYTSNAKQMSSDANAEFMWAPNKKIAANVNFDYMKRNSFSSQLAFSTPFDVMKNFDSKVKYTWANGKYTSMMSMSWNNENQLREDFSFVYPDFQLSYDAFALLSGKKSEVSLTMKYSDMSLNGNLKASHNKNTIINVILKYTSPKMSNEGELGLDFDILDYNGKMKITFKYDKQRGKLISSGDGKMNFPLQQLRQIGASYNLKHNNDVSSLDMSFSSSLRNYRNGKMSFEMNRNLPKMLKTTMELTLNSNPMFKLNGNYGRQRDNVDMKVEMTTASGKKITASANANISGNRKTANVEMKSSFLTFSADGVFEYQGTRSAGVELKMTLNGKNLMMKSDYKKEGTTCKATGILGLPNGKSMKVFGSYKNDDVINVDGTLVLLDGRKIDGTFLWSYKDNFEGSFVLNCPILQQLKHIDMKLSKVSDSVSIVSKGHIKLLPLLEKIEIESHLSTKDNTAFSFELKTPWEKFNQMKATMNLRQVSPSSRVMESEFLLNKNRIIYTKLVLDIKSRKDISISYELTTSNQIFDSIIVRFKHVGIFLSDMKSSLNVTVGQDMRLNMLLENSDRKGNLSLMTNAMNIEAWEISLTRRGDLRHLNTTLTYNHGGKEIIKCGLSINAQHPSMHILVTYPGKTQFNLHTDLNLKDISLNLVSNLRIKDQVYKFAFFYKHLAELSLTVILPSFDHQLIMISAHKSFKLWADVVYNNRNYTTFLSIDNENGKIDANFQTPYSHNNTLLFTKNGSAKKMNLHTKIIYDNLPFEFIFSNIDYYRQLKSIVSTPSRNLSVDIFFDGMVRKSNMALKFELDNKTYELKAFNSEYTRNMNVMLNTPSGQFVFQFMKEENKVVGKLSAFFEGERYEMIFQNEPDLEMSMVLGRHFEIKIVHTGDSYSSVLKAHLKVMPFLDKCSLVVRLVTQGAPMLDVVLKTPVDGWTDVHVTVTLQSNSMFVQKVTLKCTMLDKKAFEMGFFYRINSMKDFTATFEVKTSHSRFDEVSVDLKYFRQDIQVDSFFTAKLGRDLQLETVLMNSEKTSEISLKAALGEYDAQEILITRTGFRNNMEVTFLHRTGGEELFSANISIEIRSTLFNMKIKSSVFDFAFESEMNLKNVIFGLHSNLEFRGKQLYKMVVSFEELKKLQVRGSVSSYNGELTMTMDGNEEVSHANLKLKLSNVIMFDAMFQNSRRASKLSLDAQVLDFDEWKSTFELKGDFNFMTMSAITSIGKQEVNKIEFSLKQYGRSINVKVTGPNAVNFEFNMNLDTETITFNMASTFTMNGREKYTMSALYEHLSKLEIKTSIPSYKDELLITFSGPLKAFNMHTKFSHNDMIYELMLSNKEYYRQMKATLNTPYFQDTASFKFDGDLSDMNILAKVMHNNEKFQLTFSNSGYYQQIDAKLDTPYFQPTLKFSLIGNAKKFNFEFRMQFDKHTYEMKASNEEYFKMNSKIRIPNFNGDFMFNKTGLSFAVQYAKSRYEMKIKIQDNFEMSFYLMNPGFISSNLEQDDAYKIVATYEHLTKLLIETSFPHYKHGLLLTLNGDLKMFNASARFTDNSKKYELIISNKDYYRKIDAFLSTPFFQQSAMFNMKGDRKQYTLEASVTHQENSYLFGFYNGGSYRDVRTKLVTPFFQTNGSFSVGENLETVKLIFHSSYAQKSYQLSATGLNYYRNMELKVKTPSFTTEALFNLEGDYKLFLAVARFSFNDKQYNISFGNADYNSKLFAELTTPSFETDAAFTMDAKLKAFTLVSKISYEKSSYGLQVSSNNYNRDIKIKMVSPSNNMEFALKCNGSLGSLTLMAALHLNQQDYGINFVNSDIYRKIWTKVTTPYFTDSFLFHLKGDSETFSAQTTFSHDNKVYKVTVSNKDYYKEMDISVSTPLFNKSISMNLNGDLKAFNLKAIYQCDNEKYEVRVANQNYYQQIITKLTTPFSTDSVSFSFNGISDRFSSKLKAMYQNNQYELVINVTHLEMWGTLKTPSIRETAVFSFKGKPHAFNVSMRFSHNNSNYQLSVSLIGYYKRMNVELAAPFFNSEFVFNLQQANQQLVARASMTYDSHRHEISLSNSGFYRSVDIRLTSSSVTNASLSYNLKGNLKSFGLQTTFTQDQDQYTISVSNKDYFRQIHALVSTPSLKDSVSFELNGDVNTFTSRAELKHNSEEHELTISNRDFYKQISIHLKTPDSESSFSHLFEGTLANFTFTTQALYDKNQYKIVVSSSGHYREFHARLTSPFVHCSAMFSLNGTPQSFRLLVKADYETHRYQTTISNKNNFESFKAEVITSNVEKLNKYQFSFSNDGSNRQMNLQLLTPLLNELIDFNCSGNFRKFNAVLVMEHNEAAYNMNVSNGEIYQQIGFQLNTPFVVGDFRFDWSKEIINANFQMKNPKSKFELVMSGNEYSKFIEVKLVDPQRVVHLNSNIYYKKNGVTGVASAFINNSEFVFKGNYHKLGQKKILNADFRTPNFVENFHGSIAGTLRKFNADIKFQHNNDIYEMMASNKNYYDEFDFSVKAPGMSGKFQSEGDLQKFKVSARLKMASHSYEMTFENHNYLRNVNLEVSSPQTGSCTFTFGLQGNWDHFDAEGKLSYRNTEYKVDVSIDRKSELYELKVSAPQLNGNGHVNCDLKRFSFNANIVLRNEKYQIMASTKNYFREVSAKMATPQFGEQSLMMKFNGSLNDFNGVIEIKYNNVEVYRSQLSLVNDEFKVRLSLPKLREEFQTRFLSCKDNIDFSIHLLHRGEKYEMNITKSGTFKSQIVMSQWGALNVSMNGDLRNGQTKIKVISGKTLFDSAAQIRFDGNRFAMDVKGLYKIRGQSGKFDLQFTEINDKKLLKSEVRVIVADVEVSASLSSRFSPHTNVQLELRIPTFDKTEMRLHIASEGLNKMNSSLNVKTPWTKLLKMHYEHHVNSEKYLNGKVYIERNGISLADYSVHFTFNKVNTFDVRCHSDNYQNKLLVKGEVKFQGPITFVIVKVNSSFGILKQIDISAKVSPVHLSVALKLKQQVYQLGLKFTLNNGGIALSMHMDAPEDRQYQMQVSYKNEKTATRVIRSCSFKFVHPVRTVGVKYYVDRAYDSMVISSHLTWDESQDQKIGFELMVQKGRENEAKLRVITPRRTIELFGKVEVNGNHYSTMGHIMTDINNQAQKVDIKADITTSSDRADIDLTVKFPNQKKGMNLKTSVNVPNGDIIFSSRSEFSMDQDPQKTFKMSTKLMSESKGKREMYTLQMDAGHANTGFAIDMTGHVSRSPEKYNADVEMGYLNSKNERQKFAVRGEMKRISREVNLKLETPSKTIELDGSLRNGNRYMMTVLKKESGKENMEALFKLNPSAKRMNIIFNYDEENPGRMYHIDAEIIDSKTLLKAYRTDKKNNMIEDAAIQIEIKAKSILKSTIRWNLRLLQEFNDFQHQKLKTYGQQIKDFGEDFVEVFNDEIFGKLVLIKNSFAEDLLSFSDAFLADFGAVSADVQKVWQEFKEMYERNYFHMKTATKLFSRVWEEFWSSYQKKLIHLKSIIDHIFKKMAATVEEVVRTSQRNYARYQEVFRKKTNEFIVYSQDLSEKLCRNTLDIFVEINKTIDRQRALIKEIFDQIRQNPYGKKLIDILMSMYETMTEKKVQVKGHMNTLTNSIYSAHATLNRHISKVRQYPFVDAIMDAINEVYQQALWSYRYWDIKDNVLGLKNTLYKVGAEKIKEIKDIVTDIGMNTLVFDPKRGEIIVKIRFGAAKYAYNHLMSSVEDVERAVMKLSNLMPNMDFNVWDIYYMMKPSSDLYDNIPPFKAEASLFVGHHITTFDGRHLNYKGTCSYLLARDFVDGNFTVVANFDADRRSKTLKSLTVTTAHNEQLEIFPNNKVLMNGRVAKLPLQLTDATVTREGNLVVVESKRGYKVMCDHDNELYTVQISGWYFNKMAGLFGNFNNEPMDDMIMSNNKYTNDLEQFAESWSVSRQCRSHRNFAPSHMVPENRECAHLFLQIDSPYRYCFKQVNPDNFYQTCVSQMSSEGATPRELCKVTSFYVRQCEKRRVYLRYPTVCKSYSDNVLYTSEDITNSIRI